MIATDQELINRALVAYFQAGKRSGAVPPQPTSSSGVVEVDGRQYVVLAGGDGILAVYRFLTTGLLKRMKRWPEAIDEQFRQAG